MNTLKWILAKTLMKNGGYFIALVEDFHKLRWGKNYSHNCSASFKVLKNQIYLKNKKDN